MVKLFVIIGAGIFVLLGALHALYAFQDLEKPRNFTPRDENLRHAMQESGVALHPEINLWKAWMGFHFSHSLGLLMFGGAFLYIGVFYPQLFAQSALLKTCSVLIPAVYLLLSLNFWFSKPTIFAAISMSCFILAAILSFV